MQTELAVHSGKDSLQRPLVAGKTYLAKRVGVFLCVETFEDDCGTLWLSGLEPRAVRIDELDPGTVLSRIDGSTSELTECHAIGQIDKALNLAAHAREHLRVCENELCSVLGCTSGDGSPVWDAISAAVRDGMGTAVDLLDLAGALRR